LWTLLEAALLTPERSEASLSARGLSLRYEHGAVLAQSPSRWLAAQTGEPAERAHALAGILFELRQYAALLTAHQLPLSLQADAGEPVEAEAGYLLETLAAAAAGEEPPALFAHEAAGLGVVAITVAQRGDGSSMRTLAHGYPLQPGALAPLLGLLADRYGIAAELHALGRVVLDDGGRLGAPASTLH
jgi:hypothetical protein